MKNLKLKIQNDILYLFILIAVTEFFNYISTSYDYSIILSVGILGALLLETWFVRAFSIYSGKKISKYSDVIVRISLKERFFGYFILPLLFYISLLCFLFFNRNIVLGHVVLGISMFLFLVIFLNVKSSLNKLYTIENATKAIFDFVCITILYLLVNIFVRLGLDSVSFVIATLVSAFVLLMFSLKTHDRFGFWEIVISLLSSVFISFATFLCWNASIFVLPAVAALSFYLVVSIWNIRFSGGTRLSDYISPFLYVGMAVLIILYI